MRMTTQPCSRPACALVCGSDTRTSKLLYILAAPAGGLNEAAQACAGACQQGGPSMSPVITGQGCGDYPV